MQNASKGESPLRWGEPVPIYSVAKLIGKRSQCGINSALEVFGDKWTLLIIRDMLFRGSQQYGEFLTSQEGIATNILASRLVSLEESGIVTKHETQEGRSRSSYSLTQKGIDLLPVLLELMVWSDKYYRLTERGREIAERARRDRNALVEEFQSKLAAFGGSE